MKILLKLVGILVLVVAILVGIGIYFLDSGIKKAVETLGPQYIQTDVKLASARLTPWSGEGSMRGLVVGNPEGFDTPNALSLGEIALDVDIQSVTSNPVLVKSLRVIKPVITVEQGRSGSNLQQLQKNIQRSTSSESGDKVSEPATNSDTQKKIIIRELLVSGGKVRYSNPLVLGSKTVDLTLPDIRLTDIGEKSNGATGAEIAAQLIRALNKSAMSAVGNADQLKALGKEVEGRLQEEKKKIEDTIGGLKGLLGK